MEPRESLGMAVFHHCPLSLKYSELRVYMRSPRPEDLTVEHIASWYTLSYAHVISRNTTIATIGLLCAISKGKYNINVTVPLAEASHLRRLYTALGPVPVYAIEHNFFHKLADAAQESNRAV